MINCIVCRSEKFESLYNNTLKKCAACGFVTANLEISDDVLKKIYSENYFKGAEYLDYLKDKSTIQYNFRKRLDYILKKIDPKSIYSVLELGCAYGFFAELFTSVFPSKQYVGIDISEPAIKYGQDFLKQNLICTDYLQFNSQIKYSDVFMWDVIEHLKNPELIIEKIYNELEINGRIFITTGDIGSFLPRFKKNKWRMIHPPTHLHYFSASTIKKLLENKGFEMLFVSYPPIYRSIKQIFFSLFLLNKKPWFITKLIFKIIPENLNIPINTYDIMFIGAIKK